MFNWQGNSRHIRETVLRIKNSVYTKICDIDIVAYKSAEPLKFSERTKGEKTALKPGDCWGGLFDCAWFHLTANVPKLEQERQLVLVIDINGEGLLFDDEGQPLRGITNVNANFGRHNGEPAKRVFIWRSASSGGEKLDMWMDSGCNGLLGEFCEGGKVKEAFIAFCNEESRELYYDMSILNDLMNELGPDCLQRYELMDALLKACSLLRSNTTEEIRSASAILKEQLTKENGDVSLRLTATGHAHIDLAWLWPIRETKRKGARTFATALENLNRYDDFVFGSSQPQLYEWIKEDYPDLFKQIKERIDEGRWELQGALWVECDTNTVCGESLVRQILYGNRFWEKEFNKRSGFVWMPDVFGYSGALPQILKKCGISYFSTIKISWNRHNEFPHKTFYWKGIDGSQILAHMPPEGNYLSGARPSSLVRALKGMAKSGQFGEALLPFGIGDGGGGPSPFHLEYLKREKNLQGLPPVRQDTIEAFFKRIDNGANYPVWQGELYLEHHQGTYTSSAKSKWYNRKLELTLRDGEMLSAFATRVTGYTYPSEAFESIWKEVLLYQFHDILPGSSIKRVYDESYARYEKLLSRAQKLRKAGAAALTTNIETANAKEPLVIFNTLSFERRKWIEVDGKYFEAELPPLGYTVLDISRESSPATHVGNMENKYLKVEFNSSGEIISLYNKKINREMLNGPSNILLFYKDFGDSWDVMYEYRQMDPLKATLERSDYFEEGPVQKTVQIFRFEESQIKLTLSLWENSERLDIYVNADWRENNVMMRILFAPDIKPVSVEGEIQYGFVSRSMLDNTEIEKAQIEICAQRWIGVQDSGAVFSVLNDCKYGYYAKNGIIEMNALRSTNYPAVDLDKGEHEFGYSIFTAASDRGYLATTKQAMDFNTPPIYYKFPMSEDCLLCNQDKKQQGFLPPQMSFIENDSNNILIDSIKKAEDSNALVVKSYEATGTPAKTSFVYNLPVSGAFECSLDERKGSLLGDATEYHGFEINAQILE